MILGPMHAFSDRWDGPRLALPTDLRPSGASAHVFLDPKKDAAFITAGSGSPILFVANASLSPVDPGASNYVWLQPITHPRDQLPKGPVSNEPPMDALPGEEEEVSDPLAEEFNPPLLEEDEDA